MACEGRRYNGLTEVMMRGIRKDLHEMGMPITEASSGIIVNAQYGVHVEYAYSETEETLFVKIIAKPFFIPCSFIYGRLDHAVDRMQGGHDPMADR